MLRGMGHPDKRIKGTNGLGCMAQVIFTVFKTQCFFFLMSPEDMSQDTGKIAALHRKASSA